MGKPQQPASNLGMERCLQRPQRQYRLEEGALGKGPCLLPSHSPLSCVPGTLLVKDFSTELKMFSSWPEFPNRQMLQWTIFLPVSDILRKGQRGVVSERQMESAAEAASWGSCVRKPTVGARVVQESYNG